MTKEEVLAVVREHWDISPWKAAGEWKTLGHFEVREVEGTIDLGQDAVVGGMHPRRWENRGSTARLIQSLVLVQYETTGAPCEDLVFGRKDILKESPQRS